MTLDRRYESPLPRLLDEIFHDVENILRQFQRLNRTTSTFERIPEYPAFAWREAIVNAVTHRAYNIAGQMILVRLFEDRMEVESPGRLPGLIRLTNLRDAHLSRNPRIARVMGDLGFVQELGEGIDRMFDEMTALGLPPPRFRESDSTFTVTLHNDIANRQWVREASGVADVWSRLSTTQRALLIALAAQQANGGMGISAREAEAVIHRSRPTVVSILRSLTQEGLVLRIARAPTDPAAIYVLTEPALVEQIQTLAQQDGG